MNQEIKAKWVAALRSGEYKQGKTYLQNRDNTFCCLGVLCDLARKAGVQVSIIDGRIRGATLESQRLVKEWAGLDSHDPSLFQNGKGYAKDPTLSAWNDDFSYSFNQIADLIEESYM